MASEAATTSSVAHSRPSLERSESMVVTLGQIDYDRYAKKQSQQQRSSHLNASMLGRKTSDDGENMFYGCERFVVHPHSDLRLAWDVTSFSLLSFNMVTVPFSLCFDVFSQCPEPLWFFEAFVDWFFVADIVFNFFTGVFVDTIADNVKNGSKHAAQTTAGAVSSAPLVIAKQYVQSWFFIDVIASAPIDFFMSLSLNGCEAGSSDLQGSELGALKLLRALRLAKLLKLLRLLRISGARARACTRVHTVWDPSPPPTVVQR